MDLLNRTKIYTKGKSIRFLTLTYSTKLYSVEEVIERQKKDFNKFINHLRKNYDKNFTYLKIIEFTKKNYIHFHILLDIFIPIQLIQSIWKKLTGSYIAFITKVNSHRHAINYVMKYLSKTFHHEANKLYFIYKLRRFSFSKNAFEKHEKPKSNFIMLDEFFSYLDLNNSNDTNLKIQIRNILKSHFFFDESFEIVIVKNNKFQLELEIKN